jgi:hypothetical protein
MNPRRPDELVVKVIRIGDEDGSLLADHEYGAGATTDEAIEDALRRVAERHGINLEASLLTWDD